MKTQTKVAFLGLGVMGGPMAGHLARAGHQITVYNRTKARAEEWKAKWNCEGLQLSVADTPANAAHDAEIVFTCVGKDQDVEQVLLGENGALGAMSPETLLVDHTTTSANLARALFETFQTKGIGFIDAPVSGGQAGAENGNLAIMCGAGAADMERATPVMDCYAARIVHVGGPGAGQTAKMANQMCIAGVLGGLSEAIRLSQAAGLDLDKTLEAISGGAAQSWQMDNRWHTMIKDEFDFGFAIDWMRKDLGYALDEAGGLGLSSPVSELVDQFYAEIQTSGGGRFDTSALISRLPKGEK